MTTCRSLIRHLLIVVTLMSLHACTTIPVQEMSDARQALQAARSAGAEGPVYREANDLLRQAEEHLDNGEYKLARELALQARQRAMEARRQQLNSR
jgi:hypothetical protein